MAGDCATLRSWGGGYGRTPYHDFVRHDADCKHAEEPFYKQCGCSKHLRWFYNGKHNRRATKSMTWAGAEWVKREVELSYQMAGKPAQRDRLSTVRQPSKSSCATRKARMSTPRFWARIGESLSGSWNSPNTAGSLTCRKLPSLT